MRAALAAAVWLMAAAALTVARAEVDPGAPEGAVRTAHTERATDAYDLPIGRFELKSPRVRHLEGATVRSAYRLDDPDATVAGVMQGYRDRLTKLGFEPVFSCAEDACGGFDFRFDADILPPPAMLVDVRDFAQLSEHRDRPESWVSVLVSRVLGTIYIQTVSVDPKPEAPPPAPGAGTAPPEASAPSAPASAAAEPAATDTADLLARLKAQGHVRVQGLDFDVGGAVISKGSATALDTLAQMLQRNPDLSVIVVGHSDNQGPLDVNIDLSRQRAEAVRQALVERGVAPDRLEARGVGFLAPVAPNATAEGRAQNRRVELVLR